MMMSCFVKSCWRWAIGLPEEALLVTKSYTYVEPNSRKSPSFTEKPSF